MHAMCVQGAAFCLCDFCHQLRKDQGDLSEGRCEGESQQQVFSDKRQGPAEKRIIGTFWRL